MEEAKTIGTAETQVEKLVSTIIKGIQEKKGQDITVIDGKATLGVRATGDHTWFAFNEIHLSLVSAANGFDYAKALADIEAGIETLEATPAAKVRAIAIYGIDGRRADASARGIVIVKKIMSDGTIVTEKVAK